LLFMEKKITFSGKFRAPKIGMLEMGCGSTLDDVQDELREPRGPFMGCYSHHWDLEPLFDVYYYSAR
jgi:hypothetical protein